MNLSPLDRTSSAPLYHLIAQAIRKAIAEGLLAPHQELPSEGELCSYYDVSKITIRQALAQLLAEGMLYRPRPRSRLMVSPPRYSEEITRQTGFFVNDSPEGDLKETGVLAVTTVPAGEQLGTLFGVGPRALLYRVERLHGRDHEPMALSVCQFEVRRFPGILDYDLTQSLEGIHARHYGYVVTHKLQRLRPRLLTARQAELLGMSRRSPVIEIERQLFVAEQLVEYATYVLRPDRYDLVMKIPCSPEQH